MSAIQVKGELQNYYQPVRPCGKVKEGKNKMSVLNAVRNKLIYRVYAVVERGEKYDKNYSPNRVAYPVHLLASYQILVSYHVTNLKGGPAYFHKPAYCRGRYKYQLEEYLTSDTYTF